MFLYMPQNQPNAIQLHYWFSDESHSMDAFVQNKCEYEFLGILKEIAIAFEAEIVIETEPLGDGGLKRIFKIVSRTEQKKGVIITALVISLTTTILVTPIATAISEVTKHVIEKVFEDSEIKSLEKEKLKEEIKNLKTDTELKQQKLNQSSIVVKKRSNFYEVLDRYHKVNSISIVIQDNFKQPVSDEIYVNRTKFKEYVLVIDELEPKEIEGAIIDIVSPVLKKGKYKWRGLYDGEIISFNMKSNEFKTLVQTGQVEFKNGSAINCLLEVESRINNEGVVEITNYNIIRVNSYFEHDQAVETPEGKQHRRKVEADKQQLKLFDNDSSEHSKQ